MTNPNNAEELFVLAVSLAEIVKDMFKTTGKTVLSREPVVERKPIVEFRQRMRVFGMEKFEQPTYIAAVNYYTDRKEMEARKALGAVIIYVEEDFVADLLRILQYPFIEDDDDEEQLKDACGTLCNVIAGHFKSAISQLGYIELQMSPFLSYRNSAFEGIQFYPQQTDKYEISFYIEEKKRLVLELTMGPIPRR